MTRTERNRRSSLPVSRNIVAVSDRQIPAHLRPTVTASLRDPSIRRGKVRNKPAGNMWANLSPYYANSVTIDSRWSA